MSSKKYNGWSNYETWRVNLELVGEYEDYGDFLTDMTDDHPVVLGKSRKVGKACREDIAYKLSQEIKERVTEYIDANMPDDTLAGFMSAFISEVNWFEIARGMADSHAEWMEDKHA